MVFWSGAELYPTTLIRPLLVGTLLSLAICLVAGVIAGRTRGGLAASALIVALLAPWDSPAAFVLLGVGVAVLAEGAIHRDRDLVYGRLIDRVMLILAFIILLAAGIKAVTDGAIAGAIADVQLVMSPRGPVEPMSTRPPDIVMIMLDGFPGDAAASLAAKAGSPYDPDCFPRGLTDLGFHVQRNSHSNYLLTPMTLASMFDMRHLPTDPTFLEIGDEVGPGRGFRRVLDGSRALEDLHRHDYELVWVDGGFNHVETRRVDRWIDPGTIDGIEVQFLASSFFGRIVSTVAPDFPSGLHRDRLLATLADIPRLIDEPHEKPRFLFVHVPAPHSPWVFGPNGEHRTDDIRNFYSDPIGSRHIDRNEAIRRVFDQATFIADRTEHELRVLLDRPDPPVVVVFSDHGPGTDMDFHRPESSDLVERSSNFLATYTPGHPDLYNGFTTPVNIFPTLLSAYLGVDVPRQPDSIYAWSGSEANIVPIDVPGTNSR